MGLSALCLVTVLIDGWIDRARAAFHGQVAKMGISVIRWSDSKLRGDRIMRVPLSFMDDLTGIKDSHEAVSGPDHLKEAGFAECTESSEAVPADSGKPSVCPWCFDLLCPPVN